MRVSMVAARRGDQVQAQAIEAERVRVRASGRLNARAG